MTKRWLAVVSVLCLTVIGAPSAQTTESVSAEVRCPTVLGVGVASRVPFCDVLVQVDPALGVQVVLPPHRGEATLSFNLHNRHTYSRAEEEGGRAYAKYLATVTIATTEGEIIGRGAVLSEFRVAADLVDRVSGGSGETRLKAIAPTGTARVRVTVPGDVNELVVVGQSLEVVRLDGTEMFTALGRPVAILSGATIEYEPR